MIARKSSKASSSSTATTSPLLKHNSDTILPLVDPLAGANPDSMVNVSSSSKGHRSSSNKRLFIKRQLFRGNSLMNTHRVAFCLLGTICLLFVCAYSYSVSIDEKGEVSGSKGERKTSTMLAAAARSAGEVVRNRQPYLVYGTAWKKEKTSHYVAQAVEAGFRFIDTACQPKHYNEPGVGEGWTSAAEKLGLQRSDLFLQTKYTSIDGQDPNNIPYDQHAPLEEQVKQSLAISLNNLKTDYLDSWIMHSPMKTMEDTMKVWRVMESFVDEGKVHRIGISNCYDFKTFTSLHEFARIKPSVLQNRLYAESNFDTELRAFCKENNIWYQSFWTLTANRHALATPKAKEWALQKNLNTPQQLMFVFLMTLGYITPLSGTTSQAHMAEDVAVMERMQNGERFFEDEAEVRKFAALLGMPDL